MRWARMDAPPRCTAFPCDSARGDPGVAACAMRPPKHADASAPARERRTQRCTVHGRRAVREVPIGHGRRRGNVVARIRRDVVAAPGDARRYRAEVRASPACDTRGAHRRRTSGTGSPLDRSAGVRASARFAPGRAAPQQKRHRRSASRPPSRSTPVVAGSTAMPCRCFFHKGKRSGFRVAAPVRAGCAQRRDRELLSMS